MRLLISAVPVAGHLLPLLPMATAARDAGHDVAVLSSMDLRDLVAPFDVLVAGPSIRVQRETTVRRLGRDWTAPGPEAAEMFAGTRVDMTFPPALERARQFAPDLVLCDPLDFVGPMIAAALAVPWAAHGISGGLPAPFHEALDHRWASELRKYDLRASPRLAYLDPYPELLHAGPWPADRHPVRFQPYQRPDSAPGPASFADPGLPTALLTLGTTLPDPGVATGLAAALSGAGFNVVCTNDLPAELVAHPRVHHVGFTPLAELLGAADVVVSAGGTGTVLSALSAGLPLVIQPFMADQPFNAARAEHVGAARVISETGAAGTAATEVLADPRYRQAAEQVRDQIRACPTPAEVLDRLISNR
ncbi:MULTISPECIES: glycosyltransferase [Amycolatopsis]|uniref:UDP:flavonoid glycosyltransferase YjiC, YdhE family n=2 Tax=Amycolatopsis TaxID=1813 RepID=A0A1I3WHY8_9PSEU|nr:nucleotide disphospho-sugar-binding domain-containing protein [Amycolatopsis sacchari]SFK06819.1 UDP:flavonoid glycosyltransferase YjiC, YdhE family [Amycolatopsis sacchari]